MNAKDTTVTYRFAEDDGFTQNLAHDPRLALFAVCIASQQSAGFKTHLDLRQDKCPRCEGPGFNTGWGVYRFVCGAEVLNDEEGDFAAPCKAEVAA